MTQAVSYTATIGGIIKQRYIYQFEHNHGRFFQDGYSGHMIYDGDEQKGYRVIDEYFKAEKERAESMGLTYELDDPFEK